MAVDGGSRGLEQGRFRLAGWGFVLSVMAMVGCAVACVAVSSIAAVAIVPLTFASVAWCRDLADWQRLWSARHLGVRIPRPYRSRPTGGNWWDRMRWLLTDRATWRDLLWLLIINPVAGTAIAVLPVYMLLVALWYSIVGPIWYHFSPSVFNQINGFPLPNFSLVLLTGIPIGIAAVAIFWWGTKPLIVAHSKLANWLLSPVERDRMANRIAQLTESRAETVDTQAAELRRIERDLHDGAQARLVSLGMSLGMAEHLLGSDPDAAGELLAEAREATGLALAELRDLVRGIHPPVLADRGLDGAVRALALASPLPVEVTVDLPGRAPAPVESALYFAVAETLTNAAKHAHATSAWIRVAYTDGRLGVMVGDDGSGGAEQQDGGGLHGIERRLAAFDGTMMVASPVGGPTIVTMELPCVLSSVKTSPSSGTA